MMNAFVLQIRRSAADLMAAMAIICTTVVSLSSSLAKDNDTFTPPTHVRCLDNGYIPSPLIGTDCSIYPNQSTIMVDSKGRPRRKITIHYSAHSEKKPQAQWLLPSNEHKYILFLFLRHEELIACFGGVYKFNDGNYERGFDRVPDDQLPDAVKVSEHSYIIPCEESGSASLCAVHIQVLASFDKLEGTRKAQLRFDVPRAVVEGKEPPKDGQELVVREGDIIRLPVSSSSFTEYVNDFYRVRKIVPPETGLPNVAGWVELEPTLSPADAKP